MPGNGGAQQYKLWQQYRANGGTLDFNGWYNAGQPTSGGGPSPGSMTWQDGVEVYTPLKTGGSAAQMLADVTKATYEDWKSQYLPVALTMMDQTTYNNPGLVTEGVDTATYNTHKAFDAAQGIRNRTLSRYGITQTAQEQAVDARQNDMDRTASVVDAANRIRQRLADRNRTIALGGIPNLAGRDYAKGD